MPSPAANLGRLDFEATFVHGNGLFSNLIALDAVDKFDLEVAEVRLKGQAVAAVRSLREAHDKDFFKLCAKEDMLVALCALWGCKHPQCRSWTYPQCRILDVVDCAVLA